MVLAATFSGAKNKTEIFLVAAPSLAGARESVRTKVAARDASANPWKLLPAPDSLRAFAIPQLVSDELPVIAEIDQGDDSD
jgi:hypothetical protein